ncbi:MAG: tetratricopeptide repeat protein [Planctomycetes bacterium]|nr:tetratricopeptide repeat protein [Planctomycetota bacterium]
MEFDFLWEECIGRLATVDPAAVPAESASLVSELVEHPDAAARAEAAAGRFFELLTKDPRRALAEAGLAEALAREAALPFLSDLVLRRATAQFLLGYGEAAASALEVELLRVGRSGSSLQRLALLTLRAQALIARGRLQPGLVALEEALSIASLQPRQQALAVVLSAFGNARLHGGHFDSAADYYQQALEHGLAQDQIEGQAINRGNLGLVFHLQGRADEAEEAYAEALSLARQANDLRAVAVLEANRGLLATELGDLDLAEGRLEEGLSASRALGDPRREAYCMIRLAAVSREAGALETSQARLNAARPALGGDNDSQREPDLALTEHLLEQSRLALARGDAPRAAAQALESSKAAEALSYPSGVVLGRLALAAATYAGGDRVEASRLLARTAEEERDLGQPLLRGEIATLQAEVFRSLGASDLAEQALAEAIRCLGPDTPAAARAGIVRARIVAPEKPRFARSLLTHLASDAERLGWGAVALAALKCGEELGA